MWIVAANVSDYLTAIFALICSGREITCARLSRTRLPAAARPRSNLRVGADTFASDLNPVPVLLNKVVLEYIPKCGQRLADEVRRRGEWIRRESEGTGRVLPKDTDGATPIAYLWATICFASYRCSLQGLVLFGVPISSISLEAESASRSDRLLSRH